MNILRAKISQRVNRGVGHHQGQRANQGAIPFQNQSAYQSQYARQCAGQGVSHSQCVTQHVHASFRTRAWRGFNVALSVIIALSFSGLFSTAAYATESSAIEGWSESIEKTQNTSDQAYSYAEGATTANEDSNLPKKFDLRDPNGDGDESDSVVTSVKFQNPWGTCWGFAIIAASETSILSDSGKTFKDTGLDLSELQLAKSVYNNNGAPEKFVGKDQAGEGYHNSTKDPNAGISSGGLFSYGSSVFSAGIGPLLESDAPYQNSEGIMQCSVIEKGQTKAETKYLTEDEAVALEKDGATVVRYCWAGNYKDADGNTQYTTWDVDEDLWNQSILNLEDGNILPDTRNIEDGKWVGINEKSIEAVKKEMKENGRALSITYYADQSMPDQSGVSKYINQKNWAQYTYNIESANHGVTIVGWDDDYDRTNFGDGVNNLPDGNGAWLVKNSWGADSNEFPNKGAGWGNDGYFWLSYYDQSISMIESFDFDVNSYNDNTEYYIDQYNYLPERASATNSSTDPISSANIFTAEGDMSLRTLSTSVYKPNSTVNYEVYLLDDEATSPTDSQHSKKVCETSATYEYGGFHRVTLDQSDWIAMREGQRYAVVTTQQCNDDKLYYQGIAINYGQPTEEQINSYRERITEAVNKEIYDLFYMVFLMYVSAEHPDWTDAQKEEQADTLAKEMVKRYQSQIEKMVEEAVDSYANSYFVSKVNEGESWTTNANWNFESSKEAVASNDDATVNEEANTSKEIEWTDWTQVKALVEEKATSQAGQTVVADNAAIKAFSEVQDWATVEELSALEQATKKAKAALESVKISVDGSDVDKNDTWMTQEQYDALKIAVANAEAQLNLAGANYRTELLNTTPTSVVVQDTTSSLAFEVQQGTKDSGSVVPSDESNGTDEGANNAVNADNAKSNSAKTGDNMFVAVQLLTLLIALSCAGGVASVAYRRRAERE